MDIKEIQQHEINLGTVTVTSQPKQIWCNCVFCDVYTYTKYSMFDEGVCNRCKEKILNRIKLILEFE